MAIVFECAPRASDGNGNWAPIFGKKTSFPLFIPQLTPYATRRFATATKRSLVLQGLVPRSRFLQICRCYSTLHPKRNDQKSFCGSERCDTEIFLQKQAWFCRLPERARRAILQKLQKQASFCGWLQKQSCFCRQICGWRRG